MGGLGYFEDLACPKEDTTYDCVFAQSIQESIRSLPLGDFSLFTEEEVAEDLKLNKVAGPDDVDLEHLHFGGPVADLGFFQGGFQ